MELLAVLKALRSLPAGNSVMVRTDSQYVADTFNKFATVRANFALWRELEAISGDRPIKVEWIKGHAGDTHNELVDRLAQQAAKSLEKATPHQPPIAA
jgi:ribonuclease HI